VATLAHALRRIKGDLSRFVPEPLIRRLLADRTRPTRIRLLPPATTTYLFLRQVLHGNTAISHLRHLSGLSFAPSAYGQARARLPVAYFRRLHRAVIGRVRGRGADLLWRGHRLFLVDGSGFSMPDTPELQEAFGQPTGQAAGCGFPVARLLALFEASTGYLLEVVPAPVYTHDLARVTAVHPALRAGDLLVGDRAFGSFAHLALLRQRGVHALFRCHQRRGGRRRRRPADRRVSYPKPKYPPAWMSAADFAALPDRLVVREVRFRVRRPDRRVRQVTLVTTLLDARRYPAAALARLYERRWQVEGDLRHLKQTLGLDVLRCKTAPGVVKELLVFVTVYNLVRRVMREAARRQGVPARRVSFLDALRWLRQARPGEPMPRLLVNPHRPDRIEPRVRKRRPKQYPLMTRPRNVLREELLRQNLAA
jgi:hypothetical protein